MTTPGVQQFGGGEPAFERTGQQVLGQMRGAIRPPVYPVQPPARPLGNEERAEAQKAATEHRYCILCGGIHAMPSTPACPRIATFKLDGDGKISEGSFWPGTDWAKGRVVLAEDAAEEEGTGEEAGDGSE